LREALLLDLGAIIFELHRQERREPALLQAKAAELEEVDNEVRALADALGEGRGLPQLTARGLVAACTSCGGIMGVRDRHCPSCGAAAGTEPELDGGSEERPALTEADDELEDAELEFDDELEDDEIEDAEEVDEEDEAPAAHDPTTNGEQQVTDEISEPPWAMSPNGERPAAGELGGGAGGERPEATTNGEPAAGERGGGPNGERPLGAPADPGGPGRPKPGEPLVPKAQRTLRAGRRLARAWIDERRSGRR
jgi:hypothetical protein